MNRSSRKHINEAKIQNNLFLIFFKVLGDHLKGGVDRVRL